MATAEDVPSEERLLELTNQANLKFSLKNYTDAAELYSRATEMQGALRGDEMDPENAELLYLYGRCLHHVAVAKSDVLGGQVAGKKAAGKSEPADAAAVASPGQKLAEDVVEQVVEKKDTGAEPADTETKAKAEPKRHFELVDAEWSDEEDDEDGAEEAVEEEDDFATAYEILDMARVLLEQKARAIEEAYAQVEGAGKGKAKADADADADTTVIPPQLRAIKERLADTLDLQAEISMENENFAAAIEDSKRAAALKDELYPKASSIVAEAHYKVSLSLEYESVAEIRRTEAQEGEAAKKAAAALLPDAKLRDEAAREMEIAVESVKLSLGNEEKQLQGLEGDAAKQKQADISEVKEIIADMEQRLRELRAPFHANPEPDQAQMMGILGQLLGESKADQRERIEQAKEKANDLSGMVRKKKPNPPTNGAPKVEVTEGKAATAAVANGKRKMDEEEGEGEDAGEERGDGKKAKVDES